MRNLIISGTAGLLLTIAGGAAAYASNPNVPNWSPYAVVAFAANGTTIANPGYGDNPGYPPRFVGAGMSEGRSAFIEPGYDRARYGNGYGAHPEAQNTGYDNSRQNSAYPEIFDAPHF